jgi:two-component system, cell cycle sensor histidine kinase and response regulator CckA
MRGEVIYPLSRRSHATRLAIAFVVWSAIWVILSDYLVNALASPSSEWRLQTEKGLVYVGVSSLLLWFSVRAMEKDEAARRALNESRLKRLRESGLIGIAGRAADGTINYVNETLAQMLGYAYDELVGKKKIGELLSSKYAHLQEKAEKELRELGRTHLVEVELLRRDGSLVPIIGGRATLSGGEEEIIYFVDITELRKSEEARKQLLGQLLHSEKINALGQLAGGIAHDFNNELGVIIGYASLIEATSAGDDTLRGASQILKAAERSRRLIRQLLAFSRKQIMHKEVVDLNHTIREMQPMLRCLLNKNVELRADLSEDEACIEIDRSHFEQVIVNLVVNARDAMPNGGVTTISVGHSNISDAEEDSDRKLGEFVTLKVSDTGIGMEDSIKSRIFEPFFTTKENSGGTGLGLATVYGIVKQSDADISVTSKSGSGSTFTITFPKAKGKTVRAPENSREATEQLSGTILLVEDLKDLREVMTDILSRRGFRVLAASDGVDAVKIASETQSSIDLIVADITMPRMSGPETVKKIREFRPEIKVIYLSGYKESVIPEAGDTLISKPITPEALTLAIRDRLMPQTPGEHKGFAA